MITLYSTGCPKCIVLEKKLDEKNIKYEKCDDVKLMISKGMMASPVLEVNGKFMDFANAVEWVRSNNE